MLQRFSRRILLRGCGYPYWILLAVQSDTVHVSADEVISVLLMSYNNFSIILASGYLYTVRIEYL
jgi:hypothetical protein